MANERINKINIDGEEYNVSGDINTFVNNNSLMIKNENKDEYELLGSEFDIGGYFIGEDVAYPYKAATNKRMSYRDFALKVKYGKTYRLNITVSDAYKDTAQMIVCVYDESFINAYNNQISFNTKIHTKEVSGVGGWSNLTQVFTVGKTNCGEEGVGIWIDLRQAEDNPNISSDFQIISLELSEFEGYVLSNSDFVSGGIKTQKNISYPYTYNWDRRLSYYGYDLIVEYGKTYKIIANVLEEYKNDIQIDICFYDQYMINAEKEKISPFDVWDHMIDVCGWTGKLEQTFTIRETNSGNKGVGIWILFRKANGEAVTNNVIDNVKIQEVSAVDSITTNGVVCQIDCSDQYYQENWDKFTLLNAVTVSDPVEEYMAHGSSIYDGNDGYLYVPYYANQERSVESVQENIVSKVIKIPTWDFRSRTITETLRKGQDFGNFVQSNQYSPYDCLFIPKPENKFSYIFTATTSDNTSSIGVVDFDQETAQLSGDGYIANFKYTYNGETKIIPMDVPHLNIFLSEALGLQNRNIGAYPILGIPSEYDGEFYSILGGLQGQTQKNGFGGCLVKTADYGRTWEYVSYNTEFTNLIYCMWEGAIDISPEGKIYCLLRAIVDGEKYGVDSIDMDRAIAVVYDINNDVWEYPKILTGTINGEPVNNDAAIYYDENNNKQVVQFDQSRPCVFIDGNFVYMIYNIYPKLKTKWRPNGVSRSTIQISKYNKFMHLISFKRIQSDAGIHYFSIINSKGRKYMCFSEDVRHIDSACKGDIAVIPVDFLP